MHAVGCVTQSVLERIADDTAPSGRGSRYPELAASRLQSLEQVEEAHTGLHQRVAQLFVNLENPIHTLQIQHDTAA